MATASRDITATGCGEPDQAIESERARGVCHRASRPRIAALTTQDGVAQRWEHQGVIARLESGVHAREDAVNGGAALDHLFGAQRGYFFLAVAELRHDFVGVLT